MHRYRVDEGDRAGSPKVVRLTDKKAHAAVKDADSSERKKSLVLSDPRAGPGSKLFSPGDEEEAPVLRVCTLNVGGRNTNSFEFMMAGDHSELGLRWQAMYKLGVGILTKRGPATMTGLAGAVEALRGPLGEQAPDALISVLLEQETWAAMLAEATKRAPRVFNALKYRVALDPFDST